MVFCIKKFTIWLCFVLSTRKSSPEDKLLCQLPLNLKRIRDIIFKLHRMYRKDFSPVSRVIWGDFDVHHCYGIYLKGILSRCIELSEPPDELRFLLVCTFIYDMVSGMSAHENRCFRFAKIASVCLLEVYKRHYKDLFDFESFQTYCRNLNTILETRLMPEGRRKLKPFNEEKLEELMANLEELEDDDLSIEGDMLIDITEHLPKEYYPAKAETSGNETSSNEDLSEEVRIYKSDEDSNMEDEDSDSENCENCGWNCFGFANSLKEKRE